jgi:tetratricopeptide (TPR) repeat protein
MNTHPPRHRGLRLLAALVLAGGALLAHAQGNYPQAVRQSPTLAASDAAAPLLREIVADFEAGRHAEVIAKAGRLPAGANAYDRALAAQLAGTSASINRDLNRAVEAYEEVVLANGLDNDAHYDAMYNLAVVQYELGRFATSLATIDRFLAETLSDRADALSLRAYVLDKLDRSADAARQYDAVLAKSPDDRTVMMNAIALHQRARNAERAARLLADAQQRGYLRSIVEYRALYVPMVQDGRLREALAILDAGIAAGAITPGPELARDLKVIADQSTLGDDVAFSISLYERADAAATDGEAALNLAKLLWLNERKDEARSVARRALDKGLRRPEDARKLIEQPAG